MKKIIAGNWKMYGEPAMAQALAQAVAERARAQPPSVEVIVCPPAPLILMVAALLKDSKVLVGGQDCHAEAEGAHTGDVSAPMLRETGASHVIVGHSERRQGHGETSAQVRKKASRAIASGLIPIICIGETAAERDAGKAENVVGKQVTDSLPDEAKDGNFLLAYEPVWAIGTGKTPTPDDIRRMHAYIIAAAAKRLGLAPGQVLVLYGGSVKGDNAKEILAVEGVTGVLVGGASLKAEEFGKIMTAAAGLGKGT